MGKGKRSRENNAVENVNTAVATEKKSSVNLWTNVMLIALAIILVASIALSVVSSSAVLLRSSDAFKTENFEINGAMLQYMFQSQYSNFYNQYYSYMSYFTLDTSKPLRDQKFNSTSSSGIQEALLGEFDGTWFDYFWSKTEEQAREALIYCEAAKAMGLELDDEEKAEIDGFFDSLASTAATLGYPTTKAYISAMYGQGISKKDIRNTLELTQLAAKYYEQEADRILEEIKDEDVNKFFEDNKSDYYKADYISVKFDATLDAKDSKNPTEDELKAFNDDIAEAKKHASAIVECETVEEIEDYMLVYWFNEYYDGYYTTSVNDLKKNDSTTGKPTITDADLPTEDSVKEENKNKVLEAVKDAIENEKKTDDLDPMGSTAFDKVLDSVRNKLISQINTKLNSLTSEGVEYSDSTDETVWLFDEERKEGDTKVFNSDDKKAEDDDESDDSFTATAYRMIKPRYLDETLTVEFGHILISADSFDDHDHEGHDHTEEDEEKIHEEAEKLAEAEADRLLAEFLKGEINKDAFEALAKDKTEDGNVFYDDVMPGDMVTEMNDWLFAEGRKAGDTKVIKTSFGYHVTYFVGEGNKVWFVESKNDYYADLMEKWTEETKKAVTITFDESVKGKIG